MMGIGGVSSKPADIALAHPKAAHPKSNDVPANQITQQDDIPQTSYKPEIPLADQSTGQESQAKGALSLLAEGHFSPVADVRLRINFYDQLNQQAQSAAVEQFTELGEELIAELSSNIENMVGPDQQEASEDLAAVLAELEQALPSQQSDNDNLLQIAETAVTDFLAAVANILAPPEQNPSDSEGLTDEVQAAADLALSDPTSPVEDGNEGQEQQLQATLQEVIDAYLQNASEIPSQLQAGMTIEPVENVPGQAYSKFLAMYQDLAAPAAPAVEDAEPPIELDISA